MNTCEKGGRGVALLLTRNPRSLAGGSHNAGAELEPINSNDGTRMLGLLESIAYELQILEALCFDIHAK